MQIHLVSFFSKILLNVALKFSRIAASKLFEMLDKSNIPTGSGSHGMLGGPPSQLKILLLAGLLSLLGFSFAANFQISAVSLGVGFYAVATVLIIWLFGRGYPHPTLGKGNAVTLGRLVLVSFLAANLLAVENPWLVVVIAIFALVLDGVDGFLARAIPLEKITARDITDTQRRGMCMAAAMTFGLAYELWAKMPMESGYNAPASEEAGG